IGPFPNADFVRDAQSRISAQLRVHDPTAGLTWSRGCCGIARSRASHAGRYAWLPVGTDARISDGYGDRLAEAPRSVAAAGDGRPSVAQRTALPAPRVAGCACVVTTCGSAPGA